MCVTKGAVQRKLKGRSLSELLSLFSSQWSLTDKVKQQQLKKKPKDEEVVVEVESEDSVVSPISFDCGINIYCRSHRRQWLSE